MTLLQIGPGLKFATLATATTGCTSKPPGPTVKSLATRKPPGPITVTTYTQGYSQLVVKSSQTKEADKPASRTLEARWLEENKTVAIGTEGRTASYPTLYPFREAGRGHGGGWWQWAMPSEF